MDFKELFDKQRELDFMIEQGMEVPPVNEIMIRDKMLALLDEVGEMNHELKFFWGYWKKQRRYNPEKFKGEWVDVLFFHISIAIAMGITPEEASNLYRAKWEENIKRQREGY